MYSVWVFAMRASRNFIVAMDNQLNLELLDHFLVNTERRTNDDFIDVLQKLQMLIYIYFKI